MERTAWARRASLPAALAMLAVALFALNAGPALADSTGYQTYLDGSAADVQPATQPGLLLAGGATDQDGAMARFVAQAGYGDIVVLDAWGKDSYGPYILGFGADSVTTFVFNNRSGAFDPGLLDTLAHAEAIYVDGGNQWDYVHFWKDTPVEDAINAAARTKPVGGISAGLAIMGQYVYTAEQGTTDSAQALKNPYYSHVTLEKDFLALPKMGGVLTDTHWVSRDRMGRTVTFLARLIKDGWTAQGRAVAVEQGTTLWVDPTGKATFYGAGGAYFLSTTHAPEVCAKGLPLTMTGVNVYRISAPGQTFDLGTWTGKGGAAYGVSAVAGVLSSTQPGGSLY